MLSVLTGITGILMIVFSFLLTNSDFIKKIGKAKAFEDVEDSRKFIFYSLVIFAVFTVLIALCGCCFKCCKNKCFAIAYGTILLPVWLFVVIVGGLAAGASVASGETVEEQCDSLAARFTIGVGEDGDIDLSSIGKNTSGLTTGAVETTQTTLTQEQKDNYPQSIQDDALNLGIYEQSASYYTTDG